MTEVAEQHTEVVETQTVTTKTTEDGSVVTEITITKIVTGDDGEETTTTVTTTEQEMANGEGEPDVNTVTVTVNSVEESENKPDETTTEDSSPAQEETSTTVEASATPEDAEVAATAVHVAEEKKEEAPLTVVLHQFPAGRTVPNYSMFCLKLETFLRINKIPFMSAYGFKAGKKGKLPWIEYKGDKVPDSNFCIDYLNKSFGVDLDKHLSPLEKSQARAFKTMIEENTNWALLYQRWVDDYSDFKKTVSPPSSGLGFTVGLKLNQRRVKAALEHHGMGRHSEDEIYGIAEGDLRALSDFLGEKKYFMGDEVSTLDCTTFGLLANLMYDSLESPMSKVLKGELKNLVAYSERMKEEFWPDWSDVVQGDKPEPNLSKKYSFRKNKKKKSGNKDDKKDEAASGDGESNKDDEKKDEEQATGDESTAATPAANGDAADEHHEKTAEAVTAE